MSLVDHIGVFHSYQNLLGNVLHIKLKQTDMLLALTHSHHKLHLVFSSSQNVRYFPYSSLLQVELSLLPLGRFWPWCRGERNRYSSLV